MRWRLSLVLSACKRQTDLLIHKYDFNRILIFSDSKYVVDNFFKALYIWPKKRWLGANGMPVENIDLWKRLRKEVNQVLIES